MLLTIHKRKRIVYIESGFIFCIYDKINRMLAIVEILRRLFASASSSSIYSHKETVVPVSAPSLGRHSRIVGGDYPRKYVNHYTFQTTVIFKHTVGN